MGIYVYTVKNKTIELKSGEKVGLCSYAYKDCHYGFSKRIEGMIARKMSWAHKAASEFNMKGIKMLAMCDKFVKGAHVYKYHSISSGYYDVDFGGELVGELAKKGRKWVVVPVNDRW